MASLASLFTKDKKCLTILTLASKTQFDKGRYMFSFDVMKNTNCDEVEEKRQKEPEVYEKLDCLVGTRSGDIEMELSSNKCCFEFTVEGALKPATLLQKGEDKLEFNSSKTDNRRHLYLTPTYAEASEGLAFIKFWHRKEVIHKVTICDVPVIKMSLASVNVDSPDSSTGTSVDAGPSLSTMQAPTVRTTGSPISSARNEAVPISLNSTQADDDDAPGDVSVCKSAYDKILSESSLQCLASVMSPRNCRKLLIELDVKDSDIQQAEKNNPGDNETAMFRCFLLWKSSSDQINNQGLYETLIARLEGLKINDIKLRIENVFTANKKLENSDFK